MKTPDGNAERTKPKLAGRLWLAGLGLLVAAYSLWLGRDFIPALAATRSVASAIVSTRHGGNEVQLRRAFDAAKTRNPVEATLESEANPAARGNYYLSVTADTSARAKAELASLTTA